MGTYSNRYMVTYSDRYTEDLPRQVHRGPAQTDTEGSYSDRYMGTYPDRYKRDQLRQVQRETTETGTMGLTQTGSWEPT